MALPAKAAGTGVFWTEGATLPVSGKAFADTTTVWTRLPARFEGKVSDGTWRHAQSSAGLYYAFTTTSSRVSFRWSLTGEPRARAYMAAAGASGVDVYGRPAAGKPWRHVATGEPKGKLDNELSFKAAPGTVYRVYLPLYNGIGALSFGTEAGAKIFPVDEFAGKKPVVVYGGSVVQGACVSRAGLAWGNRVGRLLDAPIVNLGCDGQGKMTDADLDLLAEIDARGYVFATTGNMDRQTWLSTYEHFVRTLEARKPRTPMVLCSWHYPMESSDVARASSPLRKCPHDAALADLKLRLSREDWEVWGGMLHIVPNADLCPPGRDTTADGWHPNDAGAEAMARAVASVAEVAFPPYARTEPQIEIPLQKEKETWFRTEAYEPRDPLLASAPAPGFHGRVAPLVWIDGENAVGDEGDRTWRAKAWRNERVHGQFVVWTDAPRNHLRFKTGELVSASGAKIAATNVTARFVRYMLSWGRRYPDPLFRGDILDNAGHVRMAKNSFRPAWLTVSVPADAEPGVYRGTFTMRADGVQVDFPVELEVLAKTIPAKNDFFLDMWQMPTRIAAAHHVKPFSPEHYRLLEPHYRELAAAGQKVLTAWVSNSSYGWNAGSQIALVKYIRDKNGQSTFDFSLFDEYVAFGRRCGIGPQIHCYSLVNWTPRYHYLDAETGDDVVVTAKAGDAAWKDYWGPFLKALEAHAKEKGLLGDLYIALDEVGRDGETKAAKFLKETAPGLKLAMAGCELPERYGFTIDTYSEPLQGTNFLTKAMEEDILARRKAGRITTFYICLWPLQPNACFGNALCEQQWQGLYAALKRYDGMLRWAMHLWQRDPYFGEMIHSKDWALPGDYFLDYPGGNVSARWEMLRDSFEDYRKIAYLRETGAADAELEAALKDIDYPLVEKIDEPVFREKVERVHRALNR